MPPKKQKNQESITRIPAKRGRKPKPKPNKEAASVKCDRKKFPKTRSFKCFYF